MKKINSKLYLFNHVIEICYTKKETLFKSRPIYQKLLILKTKSNGRGSNTLRNPQTEELYNLKQY